MTFLNNFMANLKLIYLNLGLTFDFEIRSILYMNFDLFVWMFVGSFAKIQEMAMQSFDKRKFKFIIEKE